MSTVTALRTVLNLGCGNTPLSLDRFPRDQWREVRVDLDPGCEPDVVGDLRALPVPSASVEGVALMGVLEHFPETEVPVVLGECHRVLRDGGELIVLVPDLMAVARDVVAGRLTDVVERSPAGPIRPLDMLYGYSPVLASLPLMGHRTGFTGDTLGATLSAAGFDGRVEHVTRYILWASAHKM